jgi:hypothetical protein
MPFEGIQLDGTFRSTSFFSPIELKMFNYLMVS